MKFTENTTLILTLYKPTEFEIRYWSSIYLEVKEFINFHFLIDGTEVLLPDCINEKDIFKEKENVGKFKLIYNHIKAGHVKTDYFKVCDPDDYISIDFMKSFKMPNNNNSIVIFNSTRLKNKMELLQIEVEEEVWTLSKKKNRYDTYGNSYTILPTSFILKDALFSGNRIDFEDDQLLGYVCYANGAKIWKTNQSFYLYSSNSGITNDLNFPVQIEKVIVTWREINEMMSKTNKGFGFDYQNIINYYKGKEKKYFRLTSKNLGDKQKKLLDEIENMNIFK